jgi:hypothetical protein
MARVELIEKFEIAKTAWRRKPAGHLDRNT